MSIWSRAVLLVFAPACLALGVTLPLMRFESFYVLKREASLIEIVAALWNGGDAALSVLVALFSIVFPLAKLVLVAGENLAPKRCLASDRIGRLVPHLARWSMMDVFLVAIVIFAAKTSGLTEAFTQPGLWLYAGSSLMVALLHHAPNAAGDNE
ncbi:paraquat-inducible protein A [Rhizobium sp. AG855]|uniref:paraquat-inducible protein A n=1 Tax=Rhizobium sp. AG855 TaxID=2183898 RepID=UPI000FF6ADBE|nr:paraquat-inducible protein A [Rhizobium sp. AG855]RKE83907.1 paraquat-inducible protein A [Rhizobium sp. AG855]